MTTRLSLLVAVVFLSAAHHSNAQTSGGRTQDAGTALRSIFVDGPIESPESLIAVLQSQITTFPIGSSAGGFTWAFDPQLSMHVRRTRSFGPMFADRPQTNGRRKLSVNFAFQRTEWKALAGEDMREGLRTWFVADPDFGFTGHVEGDISETRITLETERTVIGAIYGITDRVDVGVLVPFGRSSISGTVNITSYDLELSRVIFREHYEATGSSSGLGDVTIRSKIGVLTRPRYSLAGGVDLRLPTGSEDKLLGTGGAQARLMLIGALTRGNASPHFNVGYTFAPGLTTPGFGRRSARPDEFHYTVGADLALNTRVTVAGDLIGRVLMDARSIVRFTELFSSNLFSEPGNVHLLLGAVGGKVLIGNMWLVTASVVFPLTDNGLKPSITPMIGFERAF